MHQAIYQSIELVYMAYAIFFLIFSFWNWCHFLTKSKYDYNKTKSLVLFLFIELLRVLVMDSQCVICDSPFPDDPDLSDCNHNAE